ncbi:ATP-binding protein [Chryseolinea sp. T2]|uniref:sensor histidine kinase n=1 Tax=Chryseolinea sp. T2 TaxID=3129255 RepID=UPI0030781735
MRMVITTRLAIWLLASALFLVIVTLSITQFRNVRSRSMEHLIEHTYNVIEASQYLLANVHTAEASHRNILLAEDDRTSHEREYSEAIVDLDSTVAVLLSLVQDNLAQQQVLTDQIVPLIESQKDKWDREIAERTFASVDMLKQAGRNRLLSSVHARTRQFIKTEQSILASRQEALNDQYLVSDAIRWFCLFGIGVVCIASIGVIRYQRDANNNLLSELAGANSGLERKVQERTAELTQRNQMLSDSLDQIVSLTKYIEQSNTRLAESLQELQFLYEHAPCGYHTVDKNDLIVKINRTELDWLGYTEEEVLGKMTVTQLMTPESVEIRRLAIEELKKHGRLEGLEFELKRKDGTTFSVLLNTIAYFDEDGNFIKNRSTLFNISERKFLEQSLRKAVYDLQELNDQRSRFLGMATHDLRNPISSVTGLMGLIRMSGNLNDDQFTYLTMAEASLRRMQDLVTRLLDLNSFERAEIKVHFERVDVRKIIAAVAENYNASAQKKDIELLTNIDGAVTNFMTDGTLLRQILDNLVSNAIKFSNAGNKVHVRAFRVEPVGIQFEVQDEGPGLTEEDIGKLFGAFQRLSARPTGGESSTGLGLSIVKALSEILNTSVEVTSTPGVGTKFWFVIPDGVQTVQKAERLKSQ